MVSYLIENELLDVSTLSGWCRERKKNHDETPLRLEKTPRHRNTQGTAIDSHLTILGVWHFLHRFLCHSLGFDLYRQKSAVDAVDMERGATWMCQQRETHVSEDTLNIKNNPGLFGLVCPSSFKSA